jgi:hypothetical protein
MAVMFGRGRFHNGVIIEPKAEYAFDPSDEKKLTDFRNDIWYDFSLRMVVYDFLLFDRPTVEKVNAFAPAHSRLFKEVGSTSAPKFRFSSSVMSYLDDLGGQPYQTILPDREGIDKAGGHSARLRGRDRVTL